MQACARRRRQSPSHRRRARCRRRGDARQVRDEADGWRDPDGARRESVRPLFQSPGLETAGLIHRRAASVQGRGNVSMIRQCRGPATGTKSGAAAAHWPGLADDRRTTTNQRQRSRIVAMTFCEPRSCRLQLSS